MQTELRLECCFVVCTFLGIVSVFFLDCWYTCKNSCSELSSSFRPCVRQSSRPKVKCCHKGFCFVFCCGCEENGTKRASSTAYREMPFVRKNAQNDSSHATDTLLRTAAQGTKEKTFVRSSGWHDVTGGKFPDKGHLRKVYEHLYLFDHSNAIQ